MLLWKFFFPVMIYSPFGRVSASEYIVSPSDGKIRFFRGFRTDEFHFKIKNNATNAKNVSYVYLLDSLDARKCYGRYIRIAIRHDLGGTAWLNIYAYNSGLTASERTTKFEDTPGKDGFRGYWIRHYQHSSNQRLNRWEFGREWDNVHPVMKIELKFPFLPRYFALEGSSTWKLEQILFGKKQSPTGFFSSADVSMVHMPTFFPPVVRIVSNSATQPSLQIAEYPPQISSKIFQQDISVTTPSNRDNAEEQSSTTKFFSEISSSPAATPSNGNSLMAKIGAFKFYLHKKDLFNEANVQNVKTQIPLPPKLRDIRINIRYSNVTFPKINIPAITLPSVTFPKITWPSIEIPTITLPKIELPNVTMPKIEIQPITLMTKIDLPNFTLPWIEFSLRTQTVFPPGPIILSKLQKLRYTIPSAVQSRDPNADKIVTNEN